MILVYISVPSKDYLNTYSYNKREFSIGLPCVHLCFRTDAVPEESDSLDSSPFINKRDRVSPYMIHHRRGSDTRVIQHDLF